MFFCFEIFPFVYSTSRCCYISPGFIYILHAINQDGCLCFRNLWLNRQFYSLSFLALVYRTSTHTIFWWLSVFKLVKWKGNKKRRHFEAMKYELNFLWDMWIENEFGGVSFVMWGRSRNRNFWISVSAMKLMNWSHQLKLWIEVIN